MVVSHSPSFARDAQLADVHASTFRTYRDNNLLQPCSRCMHLSSHDRSINSVSTSGGVDGCVVV